MVIIERVPTATRVPATTWKVQFGWVPGSFLKTIDSRSCCQHGATLTIPCGILGWQQKVQEQELE